jgi:DNA-binding transcriptional regulator YiaG
MKDEEMTAAEVRRIRADLGLTQKEFAARVRVQVLQVKRWEAGRARPHARKRARIRALAKSTVVVG